MKKFSGRVFIISTWLFILLLIPSFIAGFGEDEGTLGTNIIWIMFAKLFYILRFPTHTLFWSVVTKNTVFYFGSLAFNCMLYGLLLERLDAFAKMARYSNSTQQ